MKKVVCVVSAAFAVACQAQWTAQLLNSSAVTNEFGEIVFLDDGGGPYNGYQHATVDKAFDGDTGSFYDAEMTQGAWAGFGLQSPKLITRVRYYGRNTFGYRAAGVLIQGANLPDFSDAVTLWTLSPPSNWNGISWRDETFPLSTARTNSFLYVRFYSPLPQTYGGDIAEMQFYGADPLDDAVGVPAAPDITFSGCVNWRMNLCWEGDPLSVIFYEIERKIAHQPDFTPHAFVYSASDEMQYMDTTFLMYQDTEYRIRAVNHLGASAWITTAPALARNGATGQWVGLPGSWSNQGMTGDKAFDGNVMTFYNAHMDTGGKAWTGLDFGSPKTLTAVRYTPRHSDYGNSATRMNGGQFEVADDPGFTINLQLLHTVSGNPPSNSVTEASFAPVTARYARYFSPNNGWGNVAEVEFIQAPTAPVTPTGLSVTTSDLTNQFAALTWTSVDNLGALVSSVMVYRATSAGGPYEVVTPDGLDASATAWTDTSPLTPGIRYYYKISTLLNASPDPLESDMSGYVSHTAYMRIERTWSDLTQIKPGMGLLGLGGVYLNNPIWEVDAMFDNDQNSFVNKDALNPAIGVDLIKPYCIQSMRFAARADAPEGIRRLNGVELRGSNDPDYTNSFTRLATFAGATALQYVTIPTVNQEAFQYIFLQRPDANEFHGNIAELELYGWDPDTVNAVFRAPDPVNLSHLSNGYVLLEWEAGTAQDVYRIQRNADGETWDDIGSTQGAAFTNTTPVLNQRVLYRVIAVKTPGQGEELAYSDNYPFVAYTPGAGTGLNAAYYTSYTMEYNLNEELLGTFPEPAPDWSFPDQATPIKQGFPATATYVRIAWHGELIVPFEGDYTFYVTSDDGVALSINGTSLINKWASRAAATDEVTLHLTAGQHPLRMDYFNVTGGKTMKLEWGGAVNRAVIPASQLIPATPPANEGVFLQTDEWLGRSFGAQRLGYHTLNPDGSITIHGGGSDIWLAQESYHYVWQTIRGDFIFESTVDIVQDPLRKDSKALLMIRNALPGGSPFLALSAMSASSIGKFFVRQRLTPGASIGDAYSWAGPDMGSFRMRIKREKNVFTFSYRDAADPNATWASFPAFEDSGDVFNKDLYIGVGVCGQVQTTSQQMFQTVTFSDISIKKLNGTLLMIR